jgi:hypothetical protein
MCRQPPFGYINFLCQYHLTEKPLHLNPFSHLFMAQHSPKSDVANFKICERLQTP